MAEHLKAPGSFSDLSHKKHEKVGPVPFCNAIADPRAMMIVGGYASVALLAMFGAQGLVLIAYCAVPRFDIENYCVGVRTLLILRWSWILHGFNILVLLIDLFNRIKELVVGLTSREMVHWA